MATTTLADIDQDIAARLTQRRQELGDLQGPGLYVWSHRDVLTRTTTVGAKCVLCLDARWFSESDDYFEILGPGEAASRLDGLFRARPCNCIRPPRNISIVVGDQFVNDSPRTRKERAMSVVNKALEQRALVVKDEPKGHDFLEEEPTSEQFNREWVSAVPDRKPIYECDDLDRDLDDRDLDELTNSSTWTCAVRDMANVSVKQLAREMCMVLVRSCFGDVVASATTFDASHKPIVDGLTLELCLHNFTMMQRSDLPVPMTRAQRIVAEAMWKGQLMQRVRESATRERNQVLVDIQDVD